MICALGHAVSLAYRMLTTIIYIFCYSFHRHKLSVGAKSTKHNVLWCRNTVSSFQTYYKVTLPVVQQQNPNNCIYFRCFIMKMLCHWYLQGWVITWFNFCDCWLYDWRTFSISGLAHIECWKTWCRVNNSLKKKRNSSQDEQRSKVP